MNAVRRLTISVGAVGAGALILAAAASAHAIGKRRDHLHGAIDFVCD